MAGKRLSPIRSLKDCQICDRSILLQRSCTLNGLTSLAIKSPCVSHCFSSIFSNATPLINNFYLRVASMRKNHQKLETIVFTNCRYLFSHFLTPFLRMIPAVTKLYVGNTNISQIEMEIISKVPMRPIFWCLILILSFIVFTSTRGH